MIAPPDVVAQILVAEIALLALTFGILQFYPRIVEIWRPRSSIVPISQLIRYAGVKRLMRMLKISIGSLAASIIIGIIYLLLAVLSVINVVIPKWVDISVIVLGLVLLIISIGLLALSAIMFKEEEFGGTREK